MRAAQQAMEAEEGRKNAFKARQEAEESFRRLDDANAYKTAKTAFQQPAAEPGNAVPMPMVEEEIKKGVAEAVRQLIPGIREDITHDIGQAYEKQVKALKEANNELLSRLRVAQEEDVWATLK